MSNDYYIGTVPKDNKGEFEALIVGQLDEQQYLLDGRILVKTPHGKTFDSPLLEGFKKCTRIEALAEIDKMNDK